MNIEENRLNELVKIVKTYLLSELYFYGKSLNKDYDENICNLLVKKNDFIKTTVKKIMDISPKYDYEKNIIMVSKLILEKLKENLEDYVKEDTTSKELVEYMKLSISYMQIDKEEKIKKLFELSLNDHNQILNLYKELAFKLDINNSLDLSNFYSYLLWNGYFSIDKTHKYQMKDRYNTKGFYSLEIYKGKGVCLNYAMQLRDFLKTSGINAAAISCYIDNRNSKIDKETTKVIERQKNISKLEQLKYNLATPFTNIIARKTGNHEIVLINDEKGLYYYDPTNLCTLNPNSFDKGNLINGKGYYKIIPDSFVIPFSTNEIEEIIYKLLVNDNASRNLSCNNFYESLNKVSKIINDNKDMLDEAYSDALPRISNINHEIELNREILGDYVKTKKRN